VAPTSAKPQGAGAADGTGATDARTHDERMRVLELVASGRVTPAQGAELLRALQPPPAARSAQSSAQPLSSSWNGALGSLMAPESAPDGAQWLRLRVWDRRGVGLADVRLPLTVVGVALRLGSRWVPQLRLLDSAFLLATLRVRQGQSVFRYEDRAGGERVEITAE
jgi:hypothetical protein